MVTEERIINNSTALTNSNDDQIRFFINKRSRSQGQGGPERGHDTALGDEQDAA